jgi:aminopeptidase-like protein
MLKKYHDIAKKKLFLLNRSLTGKGNIQTLKIIKNEFPKLDIKRIKSGTKVFDWRVPPEWNVKEAYIEDENKNRLIDFKKNNLHLIGYSLPINKKIKRNELLKIIHSSKKRPFAIPYLTSYYQKYSGFCTTEKFKKDIIKKYSSSSKFYVKIDSSINNNGHMHYGELLLKGKSEKEILISTYICHPSMANNELSGPIVSMTLINYFKKIRLNYSIRFIFIPETIGSIAYISKNFENLKKNVIGGYNLSCIGDDRNHSCIFSKYKNSHSDDALLKSYKKLKIKYKEYSFLKRGSDERQYNSPGIDLKIASVCRSKYGTYPEYHTSDDDFKLVTLKGLKGGFNVVKNAIIFFQKKEIPISKYICEPQLSKRKMYATIKNTLSNNIDKYVRDFLQYADGTNDIKKISKMINVNENICKKIYLRAKKKLLIY